MSSPSTPRTAIIRTSPRRIAKIPFRNVGNVAYDNVVKTSPASRR